MITKEKWDMFECIRRSGVTNMYDVKTVVRISEFAYENPLTREDCMELICAGGYEYGMDKWGRDQVDPKYDLTTIANKRAIQKLIDWLDD